MCDLLRINKILNRVLSYAKEKEKEEMIITINNKWSAKVTRIKLPASEILDHNVLVMFVFENSFIKILIDVLRGFEKEFCSITVFTGDW